MMSKLAAGLSPLRKGLPLVLSYAASGASLLVSSAAQLLTFAILARFLGVEEFSHFVAISAVCAIAVHLCGLGTSECLVRRVARDHAIYPEMLGHSIILIVASGFALILLGALTLPFFFTVSDDPATNAAEMALMLVTNILLVRAILFAEQVFIALSDFTRANKLVMGFALIRTAAAATACLVFGVTTLSGWILWQFAAHALYLAACIAWLRPLGPPRFTLVREELRLGVFFSLPFILQAARQNADLLVLSLVATAEIIGSYSVARRIVDSSHLAVEALNRILYPGTARASANGLHLAARRVSRIFTAAIAIGAAAAAALYILAGVLPYLFGTQYVSLVAFVRILCWLAIPIAVWSTAVEALGAAGHQGERAAVLGIGSLVGTAIVALAGRYDPPTGILMASYAIEFAMMIAAWAVYFHVVRKSRQANPASIGGIA